MIGRFYGPPEFGRWRGLWYWFLPDRAGSPAGSVHGPYPTLADAKSAAAEVWQPADPGYFD